MALARSGIRPAPAPRAPRSPVARTRSHWPGALAPLITIAMMLIAWELVARSGRYPAFILPQPLDVFHRLIDATTDGTLPQAAATTLQEAGLGFAIAALIALPLGYTLAHAPLAERFLAPLIAASQAVPAVAVAPLLLLWLGNGLLPKVAVCAAIVVFPLLVTTITAVRGVGKEYLEVARVFGAPLLEQVVRIEAPLAMPVLLGGVKLGLTLSLTGAVVGEFVAADQGLGFLLNLTRENLDTPLLFATLLVLAAIGIALYAFVSYLERVVATWQG